MDPSLQKFALLCFSSLVAIINPLSAAPVFLTLTEGQTTGQRKRTPVSYTHSPSPRDTR